MVAGYGGLNSHGSVPKGGGVIPGIQLPWLESLVTWYIVYFKNLWTVLPIQKQSANVYLLIVQLLLFIVVSDNVVLTSYSTVYGKWWLQHTEAARLENTVGSGEPNYCSLCSHLLMSNDRWLDEYCCGFQVRCIRSWPDCQSSVVGHLLSPWVRGGGGYWRGCLVVHPQVRGPSPGNSFNF